MPPTQFSMLVEAKGEKGDVGLQVRTFGQPELFSETGCVQMLQEKKSISALVFCKIKVSKQCTDYVSSLRLQLCVASLH